MRETASKLATGLVPLLSGLLPFPAAAGCFLNIASPILLFTQKSSVSFRFLSSQPFIITSGFSKGIGRGFFFSYCLCISIFIVFNLHFPVCLHKTDAEYIFNYYTIEIWFLIFKTSVQTFLKAVLSFPSIQALIHFTPFCTLMILLQQIIEYLWLFLMICYCCKIFLLN